MALNWADDTLTCISNVMLIASAAWFLLDPEPFSKVGGGAVLGTGSLCAKGLRYTIIGAARAGVVALRGSRLAYVGYRAAITTQTTCRVYKWGNDRLQKNMNDEGGGGGQGNNSGGGSRKFLKPDKEAKGDHSVFKKDLQAGNKVRGYETFKPQSNPRNPNPWESVKRFDLNGKGHTNKILEKEIPTPHVHDSKCPGGVRLPEPWEIPK